MRVPSGRTIIVPFSNIYRFSGLKPDAHSYRGAEELMNEVEYDQVNILIEREEEEECAGEVLIQIILPFAHDARRQYQSSSFGY